MTLIPPRPTATARSAGTCWPVWSGSSSCCGPPPGPPDTEWLTVEDVAQELKISKSIVYRIIRSGELEAVDIVNTPGRVAGKGHYRIRRSSLNDYLHAKRVWPDSPTPQRHRPRRYPPVKNHLGL